MKKLFFLILFFTWMLSSCAGIKAAVPNTPAAKVSQAMLGKWMQAYHKRDADTLLSLWSDHVTWTSCAVSPCFSLDRQTLKPYVMRDFLNQKYQVQIQSYQITTNGSFAIVHALVTDPDAGVMAPTPAVGILEFSQGKISAETWFL